MKVYFGTLKENIIYSENVQKLLKSEVDVIHYYPKLNIVKFKTDKDLSDIDLDFFIEIEEEKNDFSI